MTTARTATVFDTLSTSRERESARIERRHAEAIATAIAAADGRAASRADLQAGLAELKADMLRMAIGIVIAQTAFTAGLTFGLVKLFGGAS